MTTAFASIQDTIMAKMTATPALAEGRVYPNRLRPIASNHSTAIVVRMDKTEGTEIVIGAMDWTTSYSIECYARTTPGSDPCDAVDAILLESWARLSDLNVSGQGVMAYTLNPQIDWQYDDADTPVVCAITQLRVQHRTPTNNLSPWN